jgi:glycylpeptide N-tetradecanoyltransferase
MKEYTWEEYALKMIKEKIERGESLTEEEDVLLQDSHKFWNTQPVLKYSEEAKEVKDIDEKKEIIKEKYKLEEGLEWYDVDLEKDLVEVYELLRDNYVEDDSNNFRFLYSIEFLKWAFTIPGMRKDWLISIKSSKTKKIIGFISGTPLNFSIPKNENEKIVRTMTEINFLCVNKDYRNKKLAPLLIQEITRRSYCVDIFQGIYTAGILLPKPISNAKYYLKPINVENLLKHKHIGLIENSIEKTIEYHSISTVLLILT